MYPPIAKFFTEMGYSLQAEVKGCDISMTKDGQLVLIEMKTGFNVTLLCQAMERQLATTQVYVAIPRPKSAKGAAFTGMMRLVKKLEIGLITVAMDSPRRAVQILAFPPPVPGGANPAKRGEILKEMSGRRANVNVGGTRGERLMTAYREKAIQIACALHAHGAMTAAALKNEHGCDAKAYDILKRNYYGWFQKLPNAAFTLTEEGRRVIEDGRYGGVAAYYL